MSGGMQRQVREGMEVYGADGQPFGVVDQVLQEGGRFNLLIGGRVVSDTAVARVEGRRVILSDPGVSLQPGPKGDQPATEPES